MAELQNIKGKYRGTVPDWYKDARGDWFPVPNSDKPMPDYMMLPDSVLDVLYDVTAPIVKPIFEKHLTLDAAGGWVPSLNRHRLLIPYPEISWDRTCQIVSRAFDAFDPALGKKVARILADSSRMKLKKEKVGNADGNCSGPGNIGKPRAVIYYQYDRTISDVIYLAHELGHLLAFDFAQENGYQGYKTFMTASVSELPAMLSQCISYDYLLNQQSDIVLQKAARQHIGGAMTRDLYVQQIAFAQIPDSNISDEEYTARVKMTLGDSWQNFVNAKSCSDKPARLHSHCTASTIGIGLYFSGLGKKQEVFDEIFKRGNDSNILNVFAAADIKTEKKLHEFFRRAVKQQAQPVIGIYKDFRAQLKADQKSSPQVTL